MTDKTETAEPVIGAQYGDPGETGNEAFQRRAGQPAEVGVPTSSADTAALAGTPPTMEAVAAAKEAAETVDETGLDEPDGQDETETDKSTLRGPLPDDFPGVKALRAENLDTYGKLRSFRGSFSKLEGIGEATEAKIRDAAGLDAYTPPS